MIDVTADDALGPDVHVAIRLAAALAIGLLIGIELGWSGREEKDGTRIGGVRTFSLAHFARKYKSNPLFMGGIMVAASIMFIRVLVEVAVVNPGLLHPLWIPVLVMFVSVLTAGYWLWRKGEAVK